MYCMHFRRSSVDVDNTRTNSSPSECYKKIQRRLRSYDGINLSDCELGEYVAEYKMDSHASERNLCQKLRKHLDQTEPEHSHDEEEEDREHQKHSSHTTMTVEKSTTSNETIFYSFAGEKNSRLEKEERQQESDEPKSYFSNRKTHSPSKEATQYEKHQRQMNLRSLHSELREGKQDDPRQPNIVATPVPFDEDQHLSSSPTSAATNETKNSIMTSKEKLVKSELRLRNELRKSCRLLDMERNKNLALKCKLDDTKSRLQTVQGSQSKDLILKEYSLQIQKLQDDVVRYREAFEGEKQKRAQVEDQLQESRQDNQKYAEQMDVLIFQHIPRVTPVFKDIGHVNFNIKESFDSVGSYRIGEVLGEGYYGSVRIGSHTRKQERFAIKLLKKSNIKRFKDLKQIATEVHVLTAYRHPNVVHLQEVIHTVDNIYMVTELCFMDLHKYHNEIGLSIESARQVIFGILQPISHLHSHGICHLDLKPENILLTKSLDSHNAKYEFVRICDFGLVNMAKRTDKNKDIIREGYACGTPGFYAPEMILQDRFEGRSADMWSLGCIILEITLGFTQEWIDSYDQAEDNHDVFRTGLKSCLMEISMEQYPNYTSLIDLLHSCLSIDSSKRITSRDALDHSWVAGIGNKVTIGNSDNML